MKNARKIATFASTIIRSKTELWISRFLHSLPYTILAQPNHQAAQAHGMNDEHKQAYCIPADSRSAEEYIHASLDRIRRRQQFSHPQIKRRQQFSGNHCTGGNQLNRQQENIHEHATHSEQKQKQLRQRNKR